jgi:siderophore synthetase component
VPLFALYGRDVRAPGDPTLLEQLVERSGEDPEHWVARRLIEPLVSLWCDVLLRTGCAVELHGQNALLRFSLDPPDTRVAMRDCAIYVDPALRGELGLAGLPPRNVISRDVDKPREQVFSMVYDAFLGSHTLSYLARLLGDRFGVDPAGLQRHARKVLAGWPGVAGLLPPTVYYYADRLPDDGRWELVDTGQPPLWR